MNTLNTTDFIGQRLDKVLSIDANITRGVAQDLIEGDKVKKNGVIFNDNSYKIKEEDIFEYEISTTALALKPKEMELNIVYEDEDLIVLNKPANLTIHPNGHNDTDTLVNVLLAKYKDNLSTIGGEFRQGIVHRLDKDTSGLMVIAKNDKTHLNLKGQLQERQLKRKYIGIIWGILKPKDGTIEGYIERDVLKMRMTTDKNARYSCTHYKTISTFLDDSLSLVEFELDTGRTHQIRVHCQYKGCPIVGDRQYGKNLHLKKEFSKYKDLVEKFPRQALHSYKMAFTHPTTNREMRFEIEMADDIGEMIETISKI